MSTQIKYKPSAANFILTLVCVQFIGFYAGSAQNIYRTNEGHVEMMAVVDNKPVKAESHKLELYLDYGTKVVNGVLNLKTLSTDIPEINTILTEEEVPHILRFTGTIPSTDFLSIVHDPIDFNWDVLVTYKNKTYKTRFKAIITHINHGAGKSCLISARGQVFVADTGLSDLIPELGKVIEVHFAQTVLKLE